MEAQTPNQAVSNKSNGQESETVAAEGKVTQKNILYVHGQKSTCMLIFSFILLYGCLGCTPFSLWKEEIFKLITFLVVRIHNKMFRNIDLGPYTK